MRTAAVPEMFKNARARVAENSFPWQKTFDMVLASAETDVASPAKSFQTDQSTFTGATFMQVPCDWSHKPSPLSLYRPAPYRFNG